MVKRMTSLSADMPSVSAAGSNPTYVDLLTLTVGLIDVHILVSWLGVVIGLYNVLISFSSCFLFTMPFNLLAKLDKWFFHSY